ncbi:FHA domain-containing protein [Ferrimicrobium sp.]|uniref:FHA domain-containing protein n=1 Tax=Ferrimicrobium sp. TaxID=2926050 RepID=UPI00262A690F|nr:FHA domain-containing protein [Ferrimicrobium sp.]
MPLLLLSALKYVLIVLIWLFFLFAMRAVWRETRRQVRTTVATNLVAVPMNEPSPKVVPVGTHPIKSQGKVLALEGPYAGKTFTFETPALLGRDAGCSIVLAEDAFVSQRHAEIYLERRHVIVMDLGSKNGTFVNGDPVEAPMRITKGDVIQLGKTALKVVAK